MLQEYGQKRDLTHTPEPPPRREGGREGPLVFVIQKHAARHLHYDLRLELGGALKSWSVPKGPSFDPEEKRLAVMVEDHPLDYRYFEGVIPQGEYGAGGVIVWDNGTYSPDDNGGLYFGDRQAAEKLMAEGLKNGKLSFVLRGQKLKGSWTLVKMHKGDKDWLLIKHRDGYADARHDVLGEGGSVISGVTVDELKSGRLPGGYPGAAASPADIPEAERAPLPSTLAPMLAESAGGPFNDSEWLFEPKLDGFRTMAFIRNGRVKLRSRRGLDVTAKYASLVPELRRQPAAEMLLDGEIIALDAGGRQCFQCLQQYLQSLKTPASGYGETTISLVYYVFDLLYLDGYDLRRVPLQQRKHLLHAALQASAHIRLVDYFPADGRSLYQAAISNGLEGVIAKKRDSAYQAGQRSSYWLKVKSVLAGDFVVGGYTRGNGAREHTFGALLLGYYDDDDRLIYVGHVGSGFDDQSLRSVSSALSALPTDSCPFAEQPPANAPVTWVRPELVVEVKYSQFTRDGYLRIPVFLRLREDKPASEVRRPGAAPSAVEVKTPAAPAAAAEKSVESILRQLHRLDGSLDLEVEGYGLALNNMDKELWPATEAHPAVTKRDLIDYLARVSTYLLPHLRDRPLTFSRYPDGIRGEHFFQKHWGSPLPPFVETVNLTSEGVRGRREYLLCNNLATLLWLGQIANLEIHSWFSRVKAGPDMASGGEADHLADFPDFIIFDIDPFIYSGREPAGGEPELNHDAFAMTCQVALWLKEVLDGLSLSSFVKTSGATGMHVYVPILRRLDFGPVRAAAETIARFLLKQHPRDITLDWAVEKRRGKIFIDYNQNVRGKTLASIYSPRPRPEATVSMPLRWDEVGPSYPADFTIFTAAERLNKVGDLWHNIMDARHDLPSSLKQKT